MDDPSSGNRPRRAYGPGLDPSAHPVVLVPSTYREGAPSDRMLGRAGDPMQDLKLVQRALAGKRRARAMLVRRLACVPAMVKLRQRRLQSLGEADANDLTQDVVALIWSHLDRYDGRSPFEGWVWGYVLRLSYKAVEAKRRRMAAEIPDGVSDPGSVGVEAASEAELGALVEESLEGLGHPTSRIVRARIYDVIEFAQIAEELDLPVGTVKSRYYRALEQLALRFSGYQSHNS